MNNTSGKPYRRLNRNEAVLGVLATALLAMSCAAEKPTIPGSTQNALLLSQMGLFTGNLREQQPNATGVMYTVNTPLFSDYTQKRRFIFVPAGKQITYDETDYWTLPVGAIVTKTFSYPVDARDPSLGERLIETRLLVQQADGLHGFTFVWNASQTDAVWTPDGASMPFSWLNEAGAMMQNSYHVPTQTQCLTCHRRNEKLTVIGLRTAQLDRDFDDGHGVMNQLQRLATRGILPANAPIAAPHARLVALDAPNETVETRTRSYLDANCSHCHRTGGYASEITTLRLRWVDSVLPTNAQLGFCVQSKRSLEGRVNIIVPGAPDRSEMITRLHATNPFDHMPRSSNQLIYTEADTLIQRWISSLPPQVCPQ